MLSCLDVLDFLLPKELYIYSVTVNIIYNEFSNLIYLCM